MLHNIWNVIKLCFSGLYELLQDSSGTFALLCLLAISVVTFFKPQIGAIGIAAYLTVVPGVLAYVNHKITLAGLGSQVVTTQSAPPSVTVVDTTVQSQTASITQNDALPPKGQL